MEVLMIFMSDENGARSPCCLYANPTNQKLSIPAYLHLQVFMVSLPRANQPQDLHYGLEHLAIDDGKLAGRHGVARCVLPILSLVVLPWLACIHRGAYRLLSDGGEAGDMIDGNRSPPIAFYRHQATFFDGKSDGKLW
jgi:hypothetical protein